jgi:subtilase family serine protease
LCTTQFLPSYFSIHDDWGNIYIELNSDNPVARGDNTTLTIPPNTIFQILSDNTIITNNEIVINFVVPTNKNLILQFGNSIPIGVSEFYTLL